MKICLLLFTFGVVAISSTYGAGDCAWADLHEHHAQRNRIQELLTQRSDKSLVSYDGTYNFEHGSVSYATIADSSADCNHSQKRFKCRCLPDPNAELIKCRVYRKIRPDGTGRRIFRECSDDFDTKYYKQVMHDGEHQFPAKFFDCPWYSVPSAKARETVVGALNRIPGNYTIVELKSHSESSTSGIDGTTTSTVTFTVAPTLDGCNFQHGCNCTYERFEVPVQCTASGTFYRLSKTLNTLEVSCENDLVPTCPHDVLTSMAEKRAVDTVVADINRQSSQGYQLHAITPPTIIERTVQEDGVTGVQNTMSLSFTLIAGCWNDDECVCSPLPLHHTLSCSGTAVTSSHTSTNIFVDVSCHGEGAHYSVDTTGHLTESEVDAPVAAELTPAADKREKMRTLFRLAYCNGLYVRSVYHKLVYWTKVNNAFQPGRSPVPESTRVRTNWGVVHGTTAPDTEETEQP